MSKTNNERAEIGIIKSNAERFANGKGGIPNKFIEGALRHQFLTRAELGELVGVSEKHALKAACQSGNKDLTKLARLIVERAQQRLTA